MAPGEPPSAEQSGTWRPPRCVETAPRMRPDWWCRLRSRDGGEAGPHTAVAFCGRLVLCAGGQRDILALPRFSHLAAAPRATANVHHRIPQFQWATLSFRREMRLGLGAQTWPGFWRYLYLLGPSSEGHPCFSSGDVDTLAWASRRGQEGAGLLRACGARLSLLSHHKQQRPCQHGTRCSNQPSPSWVPPHFPPGFQAQSAARGPQTQTPSPVPGSPRQLAGEGAPAGLVWQTRLPCRGHLCRPDFGDWGWLEWGRVEGSGQGPAVIYSPLPTALSPTPLPPSPPPPTRPPRRETEESEWGWPGHCSRRPSPVGGRNTEESVGDGRGLGS